MAFSLSVQGGTLPTNLRIEWAQAFASVDIPLTFSPNLSGAWGGGFLPCQVQRLPAPWCGPSPGENLLLGFELALDGNDAHFRSPSGRSVGDFVVTCLGAALLAELSGGTYVDPQAGRTHTATEARDAALREIAAFVPTARPREWAHRPFPGWEALQR